MSPALDPTTPLAIVVVDERWRSADLVGPDEMRLFLGHDSPGTS